MVTASAAVERASDRTDRELVRAVRRGDDRAFEALYTRYQRRITGYVYGMVSDHGRAEDLTQEIFVAALRRIRETERPIAFKPWIYEIARNACIDAYRRGRRAEEVSFDAGDRLSPDDFGRLVAPEPRPDVAIDLKQDIDHLCGAFGGLSDTHHQILVMRELEGRSYKDIGERMGMTRPAVESTLFRARKRLGEEYDELASGARCLRVQGIIADAATDRLGVREQRKLARHVSHCQPCRRLAVRAGLEIPVPARRRIAERIPAWLPLPAFLRLRRGGEELAPAGGGGAWVTHVPTLAESMHSGWSKALAGLAAVVAAGAGLGVTTPRTGVRDERGTAHRPSVERTAGSPAGERGRAPRASATTPSRKSADRRRGGGTAQRRGGTVRRGAPSGGADRSTGAGGAPAAQRDPAPAAGGGAGGAAPRGAGGRDAPQVPAVQLPPAASEPVEQVTSGSPRTPLPDVEVPPVVGGGGGDAVEDVEDTVDDTVDDAVDTVDDAVDTVQDTVDSVDDTVQDTTDTVTGPADDLLNP